MDHANDCDNDDNDHLDCIHVFSRAVDVQVQGSPPSFLVLVQQLQQLCVPLPRQHASDLEFEKGCAKMSHGHGEAFLTTAELPACQLIQSQLRRSSRVPSALIYTPLHPVHLAAQTLHAFYLANLQSTATIQCRAALLNKYSAGELLGSR